MTHLETAGWLEELRKHLKLRAADLASLKSDIKTARKSLKTKEKKNKGPAPEVKDLEEVFRLHPAIDFLGDAMSIGFRMDLPENDSGQLLLISDGQSVRAEVNPDVIEIGNRVHQVTRNIAPPFLNDVWGLTPLKAFLNRPLRPHNLYGHLVAAFKTYLDLAEPAYGLMAAWTVGTYFAHLFNAFPFLHFHGPKETGKSKLLEALRCVCFNAWKGRDITPAALGDTMDGQRGTLLLDQAEKLNNDKEYGNLIGLISDSYKQAGGKRRVVEVTKAGRTVLEFSTYGPKAFASQKLLDPDLADRCIRVAMTRTRKRLPDLEGWEPMWGGLRDKLCRFTLAAFKEVQAHYKEIEGNGTRIGELWRPLLAVLLVLGVEQGEVEAVRALFMEGAEEGRHELDPWESILFEVLKEKAESGADAFEMTAEDVLKAMDIQGESQPGAKWVGNALSRFSLYSKRLPRKYTDDRRRKVQPYLFDSALVLKLYEIYVRDTPQNEASQASQDENNNDSGEFHRTEKDYGTCPKASQKEEKVDLGRNGTCPENSERPTEHIVTTDNYDFGRMGREKSGGPTEKNISTEEELLAGGII
jgi:hypothetical protein